MSRRSPARQRGPRRFFSSPGEALVWALLLLPPLLVSPTRADAFDLPKLLASEWLGLASLVLLALGLRHAGRLDPGAVWRRFPALRAVLPALVVATAGLAFTAHRGHALRALPDLWIGAACLVGWSVALDERRQRRLLTGLLLPAGVLAALGALQFHDLYRPFEFAAGEETARLGVTSLAGNAGVLADYLVLPALVAQWLLWRHRRRRGMMALAGAALALCLYGLATTQTVAALLALAAASVVLWSLLLPRRRALVALAAAAALALVVVAGVAPLRQRIAAKTGELATGDWDKALAGRLDGWWAAAWMAGRHPLTGVGHGAYSAEFADAKIALSEGGTRFFRGQTLVMFANAHNELLEVAAEWGLPGLAALGWGLWVLLAALRRRHGPEAALAWAGCAALAVLAVAHFPFRVALVAYPALIFLAWVLRPAEPGEKPA